jgi:AAA15 family ATPase/GTPase
MLLEFSVENFLSFRDRKTLYLSATAVKEYADRNLITLERDQLLRGAVIYGANASGKSNLIRAMSTMHRLVLQSFEQPSTAELNITPFLLDADNEQKPSSFEVLFLLDGLRYRYGFEVDDSAIRSEWLFEAKRQTERPLFIRENDGIDVTRNFPEGKGLEEKTRDNALFLAVADQFNGKKAKAIMNWFNNLVTISGLSHERYTGITFSLLENKETKPTLQTFFNNADLGFDSLKLDKKEFDATRLLNDMPESVMQEISMKLQGQTIVNAITLHKKYDDKKKVVGNVEFNMDSQESAGTNKLFNMSGPVFDVLHNGGILVVDELDASLHPLLTLAITKLFNSKGHNPRNAQLIFTTQATNLLSYGNYRRDQIYFVEKDKYGASDLYSLVKYKEDSVAKTIRKDPAFEKDYIKGRYGAVPFIGNLLNSTKEWPEK